MKAIVQIRGEVHMSAAVRDTLEMLNLGRVNHATLVPETDAYRGMITKVNDFVAVGEPSVETLAEVLERRAEPAEGDAAVDDEWVEQNTWFNDVEDLAEALLAEDTTLQETGLSPTIRLHPPRGGHDGIKRPVAQGGQLGKHETDDIDALLEAMR